MSKPKTWLWETVRSGTIASLVMMPVGFFFQWAGWRVGHYGPKVAAWFMEAPTPPFLFAQHLVIGWLSTWPLLLWMVHTRAGRAALHG